MTDMLKGSKLTIRQEHIQQLIDHALRGLPNEVCGLIGGKDGTAEVVVLIANGSPTPLIAFELDRRAMVKTIIGFQKQAREVVAIYHSHPQGDAIPSERDIAEATWPYVVYIIVGLEDVNAPDVRAWIISQGNMYPVELDILSA
jgi:proteasome lid subunit RPN8/RPN11